MRRRQEQRGVDPAFYAERFRYQAEANAYTCPAGQTLPYQTTQHDPVGVGRHVYIARAGDCQRCAFQAPCCPGARRRRIVRSEPVPAVAAYVTKRQTAAARAAYRWRAPVAEFSNLRLRAKLGLRQFCVRGLHKVRCEVLWACLNIQQWFRRRWKGRLTPASA